MKKPDALIKGLPAFCIGKGSRMCSVLAIAPFIFASMTTYYCHTIEEALKRAKKAGRKPGCFYGGIVLRLGRRGFALYREGKGIEQYGKIPSSSAFRQTGADPP